MPSLKQSLKTLVARLVRPGVHGIDLNVRDAQLRLEALDRRMARMEDLLERVAGETIQREKHTEELGYWRWLIKTEKGRASLWAPFDVAFGQWQRDRLRELGEFLSLGKAENGAMASLDDAVDRWCEGISVLEIGAGPYPAVAAAPRWRRAVAVDPIAKGYAEEGLLPDKAAHITYIQSPGERVPLPAGFADLVIIENALDHVSDPAAVLLEIRRLLCESGMLWLLVDLSNYSDHMHPHPFNEERLRRLLKDAGFEPIRDRVSDHKSHPRAYGEYRGLLRRVGVHATKGPGGADQLARRSAQTQ